MTVGEAASLADTPLSVWQRAADPKGATVERVHGAVEEHLARASHPIARHAALEDARSLLEAALAAGVDAPLLHYDLAQVYYAQKRHALVLRELAPIVAAPPDASVSLAQAWDMLAMTYAHLEMHQEERDAHREHLKLLRKDGSRAIATMNLAESEMSLGHLDESIVLYREAFRVASEFTFGSAPALCVWGLAVALDRSGDPALALSEATRANALDPSAQALTSDSVFFAPAYERNWYLALSAEATARSVPEAQQERYLVAAGAYFRDYVTKASEKGRKDRWLELAKKRAEHLEKLAARAIAARIKRSGGGRIVGPRIQLPR